PSTSAASQASMSGATHASTSTSSIMTLPSFVRLGPYHTTVWTAERAPVRVVWPLPCAAAPRWPGHLATKTTTIPPQHGERYRDRGVPVGHREGRDGGREGRLGRDGAALAAGSSHSPLRPPRPRCFPLNRGPNSPRGHTLGGTFPPTRVNRPAATAAGSAA